MSKFKNNVPAVIVALFFVVMLSISNAAVSSSSCCSSNPADAIRIGLGTVKKSSTINIPFVFDRKNFHEITIESYYKSQAEFLFLYSANLKAHMDWPISKSKSQIASKGWTLNAIEETIYTPALRIPSNLEPMEFKVLKVTF